MAQIDFYFNSRSTGNWTDPDFLIDHILTNFGHTSTTGLTEYLDANDCPGTGLGFIIKVELGLFAQGDGDDNMHTTPYINGVAPGSYWLHTPGASPGWTYRDITGDKASWSFNDIKDLDCEIDYIKSGKANEMYCGEVRIRVTYWAPPVADIDVGAAPIDRGSFYANDRTIVNKSNPANASGTLHSIKIWAETNMTGLRVGTFYTTNGNTLKCRDSEVIGNVVAGAERTFTELSIAVEAGDYIGCYFATGRIEQDTGVSDDIWTIEGEYIDPNDEAIYNLLTSREVSLYGYGDFAVAAPRHGIVNFQDPGIV